MKKKELLKQSKMLAAVITAVAIMDAPVVAHAAEDAATENVQDNSTVAESSTEAPVEETPVAEAPTESKTPAEETPVAEVPTESKTLAEETPVAETPTESKTPAEETPVAETPTEEETPSEEVPGKEETQTEEAPDKEEKSSDETQTEETPTEDENTTDTDTTGTETSVQDELQGDEASTEDGTSIEEESSEITPTPAEEITPSPLPEEIVSAVSEVQDGWVQEGDDWYYYQNGKKVTDDEVTYYDEDGNLVTGRVDQDGKKMVNAWYENEYGDKFYYDSKGLQANGLTEIDGKTYYFTSYMNKNYIMIDNGVFYHFGEDGSADAKQSVDTDDWVQAGDDYYYIKDKEVVKNQFLTVGDNTYYFGYYGVMYKDGLYDIYDEESHTYKHYRINDKGQVFKGWYQEEGDSNKYYYGTDGAQAEGLTTIDGKTYYFDSQMVTDQAVTVDGTFYYFGTDGQLEKSQDLNKEGWIQVGDDFYYAKNEDLVRDDFVKVNGTTYYMNYDGRMLTDTSFGHYNSKKEKWCYYRVDAQGHLITGWYKSDEDWDGTFYYDSDGVRAEGLTTIDGKTYYFDYQMVVSRGITMDDNFYYFGADGTLVVSQSLNKDGWVQAEDFWFYIKNKELVKDDFVNLGKYTYYMNSYGVMVKDGQFGRYDNESGEWRNYRVDDQGHLITGWYKSDEENSWYYYGVDGAQAEGLTTIDGKTYYFNSQMLTDYGVTVEGVFYYFGTDGELEKSQKLDKDGWIQVKDKWYYVKDKELVRNDFVNLGEYTYYMDYSGVMLKDTTISQYDSDNDTYKYYFLDENGHMVKGWHRYDQDSPWYYYGTDGVRAEGLTTVNGKTYYFSPEMATDYVITENGTLYYFGADGVLAKSQSLGQDGWAKVGDNWCYIKGGDIVRGDFVELGRYTYYMDYTGIMQTDSEISHYDSEKDAYRYYRVDKEGHIVKGWYQQSEDDDWYYYGSDGARAEGITEINGKTYYFTNWMQTDYAVSENGYMYYFGTDGVLASKQSIDKDGWIQVGKNWYYAKNKEIIRNQFLVLGNFTYYMGYDGSMLTDSTFNQYDSETDTYKYYRVDADGHIVKGWYRSEEDSDWYYYDSDGVSANGITTIGGKTYYFDGWMRCDCVVAEDGYLYYFNESGELAKKHTLANDGWIQINDNWYYAKDKNLVRDDMLTLGKDTYFFDSDGEMKVDTGFQWYDEEVGHYCDYRVDKNGHLLRNAWYKSLYADDSDDENDEGVIYWYYYDADGHRVYGIQTINGKTYYFDPYMKTETAVTENGQFLYFDQDGVQKIQKTLDKNQWIQVGDNWYYVKDKELVRMRVLKIGNQTYGFGSDGKMLVNATFWAYDSNVDDSDGYRYRTDSLGHVITGWYYDQEDHEWYYYQNNGRAANGVVTVNNKKYYFDYDGRMRTQEVGVLDGVLYYFGKDGNVSASVSIKTDGWKQLPVGFYYAENGKLVTDGFKQIGDHTYYFYNDGLMACNEVRIIDDEDGNSEEYRFDSLGHMVKGWFEANAGWYYYDKEGHALHGIQTVNNKIYYFVNGQMQLNWTRVMDGKLYVFGMDGVGKVCSQNGWVNLTYYVENGKLVTGWKMINNTWYYFYPDTGERARGNILRIGSALYSFDNDGKMMTGLVHSAYGVVYADSNGRLQESGWRKTASGKWYYFDEGTAVQGVRRINGSYNIFRADGTWFKAVSESENGWLYDGENYYYAVNGYLVSDGSKTVNGKTYFFDENGVMCKDGLYHNDQEENGAHYYLNKSGEALTNAWVESQPGVYWYFEADGKRVENGWKKINNKWYYFDENGTMANRDMFIDGKWYKFSSSGECDGVAKIMTSGWNIIDGRYYYVKDNIMIRNSVQTIGNEQYYFDYSGRMEYNTIVYIGDGNTYFAQTNGAFAKNGWCNNGNSYAAQNGALYTGKHTIGGKTYMFTEDGLLVRENGLSEDNKVISITDQNGVLKGTVTAQKDGWVQTSDGNWYFVRNGVFLSNRLLEINGKGYYFYYDGKMMKNNYVSGVGYAGEDGVVSANGWFKNTVYFVEGRSYSETGSLPTVDGKHYLIYYGRNVAGVYCVDHNNYYFDGKGNRTLLNLKRGWNEVSGKWYYVNEYGTVLHDSSFEKIGDKFYYFDGLGAMVTNQLQMVEVEFENSYDSHMAYFDADGMSVKNCWKTVNGDTYYFDSNGWAVTGRRQIDGKWYDFDQNGVMLH